MNQRITKYLNDIEQENKIKILLACETGSRAWGFPSPDSDFDVRIIYMHKRDWYLSLTEGKDSIEKMLDNNEIDITGWDLRKTLRLLHKSNPPLLERIQSPIIYRCDKDFLNGINELAKSQYSRIATIHHYLNMATKTFDEIKEVEEYKLKKFFYALRSAIACKWVIEKEEIPPIEFQKMINGLKLESNIENSILELISLKATISEGYLHKGEKNLVSFIENCIQEADAKRLTLPAAKGSLNDLNKFFIKTLSDYDS